MIFQGFIFIGADKRAVAYNFSEASTSVESTSILSMKDMITCTCDSFKCSSNCVHVSAVESPQYIRFPLEYISAEKYEIKQGDVLFFREDFSVILRGFQSIPFSRIVSFLFNSTIQEIKDDNFPPYRTMEGDLKIDKSPSEWATICERSLSSGDSIHDVSPIDGDKKQSTSSKPKPKKKSKVPAWARIPLPNPEQFYVDKYTWEQLLYSLHYGGSILIVGPSGSGKSELAYLAANLVGQKITSFNFGAMTEPRSSLIGDTHLSENGTWFKQSRFVKAIQEENSVLLLDEITRANRSAFNILLPLMDRQGYLALDEHDEAPIVKKAKGVTFVATANIGLEYTGTDAMDRALRDRFSAVLDLSWPPLVMEANLLVSRCGLDRSAAETLASVAHIQRQMAKEGEFADQISTRQLIATAERVANGMSLRSAVNACIATQFSSDGDDESDRTKIKQCFQRHNIEI